MYDDDIGADRRLILAAFYTGITRVLENRFVQSKLGLIEYEDLEEFGVKARDWRQPYFRNFWALRKDHYTIDFQEYVEREILSQTTVDGILDNPEPVNK